VDAQRLQSRLLTIDGGSLADWLPGTRSCYGKTMLPRMVAICLLLVGCTEAASPVAPATSSQAPEDDEPAGRGFMDRRESQYRSRVRAFLKQGFAVQGLGLPPEELKQLRSEASCQLDATGVVIACTTTQPSGNAKFDAAVTAALEAKKGLETPPPPDDQPGWRKDHITMSLRCGPTCN
jgi:hypothetical protein